MAPVGLAATPLPDNVKGIAPSEMPPESASAPPLETVAADEVPKPLLLSTRTVPPELTCTAPVNVFAAERVNVPAPAIVNPPPPLITPPAAVLPTPLNVRPKFLAVVLIARLSGSAA